MSIIVIAPDDTRSNILVAGLELSGYQNQVLTANTRQSILSLIAQHPPRLIIMDQSLENKRAIFQAIQPAHDAPIICIGDEEIPATTSLPYPYEFRDFLAAVYDLAPLSINKHDASRFTNPAEVEIKYRDLFDRASDGIFLIDYDTHIIIDANRQVCEIYGYALDELIGMSLLQIVPHEEHPDMLANTRQMEEERTVLRVANRTHIKKDGTFLSVSISAALIEIGGRLVFQDIVRDETERIHQEEELIRLNQVKDDFVSNISHELRTPLTSLYLRLHLLKKSPQAMDRHVSTIEREVDRLEGLIENLLILSRLDQDREVFAFTEFDINDLISEYYLDRQPVAETAQLTFTYTKLVEFAPVNASRDLLGQVLSILLTNAINYTPEGGQVELTTALTTINNEKWVQFSVRDTGNGIPDNEIPSLFTRFYRGKVGRNSEKSGTGLGLSIAKEIVDRHGGHITVESDGIPGKGTTFTVWLPPAEESIQMHLP